MTKARPLTTSTFDTTESVTSSSAGALTPRSEDAVIASVESENTTNQALHSRTPSVSLTPPPSSSKEDPGPLRSAKAKGKAVLRGGDDTDGIDARLGNVRLSSPELNLGMSSVAAAIESVARGSTSPAPSLLEPVPSEVGDASRSRRISRRRSSSQANRVPHDVRDEEPPHDRFHEPAFQQAFGDARRLMSELTDVLGSSPLHVDPDSTMQRLHQQAGELAHFQCPSTRTVGFVGDSGVGKSSLLNSLLDCPGLARTTNAGAACTCVVTEYRYHDSADFAVEVELFTMGEILMQLTELLRSYRHFHIHGAEMEREEKKDIEDRANVAQDTFRAMFRGHLDTERFLIDRPEDSVLETLMSWANDTCPSSIAGRKVGYNFADCSTLLMQLSSEQISAQEPAVWPYIRTIKVFFNAHILSKGLVLVDLPGLRDLNSARRNITERYLLQCDEIFAICYIGRATTDAGVLSVFELARRAGLSNVSIICTRSEDIRAEEARKDWKEDQRAEKIQDLIDAVAKDLRNCKDISAELAEYDEAGDDLSDDEKEEQLRLGRCLRNAQNQLTQHKFEQQGYLINTRNSSVAEKLDNLYSSRVSSGRMHVFCVSNTLYLEHRQASKVDALPYLQLSGIIAIRKHCISMVAESQLRSATKYIRDDIPALLSDVELWVQSGAGSVSVERKQAVRETLDALEARLKRDLSGNSSQNNRIARSFKREFRVQVYDRRRIRNWSQAARNAGHEWAGWHHSTYAVFCQHYGNHHTAAVGSRDWNEEAIESMTGDVTPLWQDLCSTLQHTNEDTARSIEDLLDWAIEYLDTELQDLSESTATLSQALTSRQNLILADVEEACKKFETSLATLRTDALSGIRSSLIGQAMEDSYRACIHDSRRNSDGRRKATINGTLRRETLFEDLMKEFRDRFGAIADVLQSDIQTAVATHLDGIRGTLDIIRSENVALESEQDPEFRRRVEGEVRTAKEEIRRIRGVVGP